MKTMTKKVGQYGTRVYRWTECGGAKFTLAISGRVAVLTCTDRGNGPIHPQGRVMPRKDAAALLWAAK